ncbi:MAG: mucoidy inhibitor MuiA family protein [Thermodesulfobacteriota bacterium]|nr:mucoidy inhibitor MuiA family protein [Thermodesulfobacteriota bacterium]
MKSRVSKRMGEGTLCQRIGAVGYGLLGMSLGKRAMTLLLAAFGLVLAVSLSAAQETVPSQIQAVTLFSNQALVTREAQVQVREGLNEILLEVKAFRVDSDSVSARVLGDGEVYSVQLKEIYLEEAPQENIRALEEKLRELQASLKVVEDSKAVLKNKEQFLGSVIDFAKTQVPQDIKTSFPQTEDLEKTMAFLGNNFEQIHHQRQSLNDKTESISKEIQVVERELASLTARQQREKKTIEVLFNAKEEQQIKIQASYLVYNAFWQPLYKAAVPLDLKAVNLTMFSKIHQKTGEDWQNVDLFVSNVVPLKGAGLPQLPSWILDIQRPETGVYRREHIGLSRKTAAPMASDEMDKTVAEETKAEREAGFVMARRKELPLSFEYQMPRKLTIESKDKESLLPLFTKTLKGEFLHYAAPKITPLSFLVCKAIADKELLGGPMNVHFGTHFVGKTFLKEKKPGETFDLNLGADREVKVKREKITDKVKETFFGKFERDTVVRSMAFKITAENLKNNPLTINILESIPVSRTDKIKVEDLKIRPEPTEKNYQDREGVHRWSFVLQPKGVKQIDVSFVVSYPKEEPLLGL